MKKLAPEIIAFCAAIALLLAVFAAVLFSAPCAHADGVQDAQFLQLITSHGMTFEDADVALREGHAVCITLAEGFSDDAVIGAVDQYMPITYDQAVTVVAAAMVSFCPQYLPSHPQMQYAV